ncbi:MAG TPA: [FeFe] hydrogenase H-cluster radical SAM maturase HydE [Thermoanaerobacterales bacterium]|nr:[FeFe] hydrogenase H-cluster radical SAM maturase HydE [Thermoanaerobacterales bacterium]
MNYKDIVKKEEIIYLLSLKGKPLRRLYCLADKIREDHVGNEVHLRAIIEFSNFCRKNCLYCGLRRENKILKRYRMSPQEIIQTAFKVIKLGYQTIVLQSGEDPGYPREDIVNIIREIKGYGAAVTLSLGERTKEDYFLFKEAGADRYLLKHEAACPDLFKRIKPDSSQEKRLRCLIWLKELGYEVGAGNIVGFPGQTLEDIAEDIIFMKNMDIDMAGIGPLIPHNETPFAGMKTIDPDLVLKTLAITRLILNDINLPATTAMDTLMKNGREEALKVGANVLMLDVTPAEYKRYYDIYPRKGTMELEEAKKLISKLGRVPGKGKGDRRVKGKNIV